MVFATITEPTTTRPVGTVLVATFDGKNTPLPSALEFTSRHQVNIANLISPPSGHDQTGFRKIVTNPKLYTVTADGVLFTDKRAIGIWSRDCPIVIITDKVRCETVVFHAGRPAMTPYQHLADRNYTIAKSALHVLTSRGSNVDDLSTYITGAICKKCFTHDIKKDVALLTPFADRNSWAIDPETGGLDLVGIIMSQLLQGGVPEGALAYDGRCTKEDPGLASKRNGDDATKNNLVVVLPYQP